MARCGVWRATVHVLTGLPVGLAGAATTLPALLVAVVRKRSPRPTRSAAGSSATCTTVRNSGWSPWR